MKLCPQCGTQNRDVARFCQSCSQALVSELICPSCSESNPVQARFCLNCAEPLRGRSLPTVTPQAQPQPSNLTGMLQPDTVLASRYKVVGKLGKGGMGAVYQVFDTRLTGKQWAMKELSDAAILDPQERQHTIEAFKHEATLLASLNHLNLTRVVDYFQENNKYYLVMDLVEGNTLEELLLARTTPFPESTVIGWALQLCEVLEYLHNQNPPIIFRDLKPSNIMFDQDGHIRLIDFGVARLFKPGKSKDTASFGTAGYAPPEQYGKGQTDARSDLYALAATLHHLLTLRDPADTPFKFAAIQSINPQVSQNTSEVIHTALQMEPANRWQTAVAFANALLENGTVAVQTSSAAPLQKAASDKILPPQVGNTCPACGFPNPLEQSTCLRCGAILKPSMSPVIQPAISPSLASGSAAGIQANAGASPAIKGATANSHTKAPLGWGATVLWVVAVLVLNALIGGFLSQFLYDAGIPVLYYITGLVSFCLALYAAIITKRPLVFTTIFLLPAIISGNIQFIPTLIHVAPIELLFLISRYKHFSFWALMAAILLREFLYLLFLATQFDEFLFSAVFLPNILVSFIGTIIVWRIAKKRQII